MKEEHVDELLEVLENGEFDKIVNDEDGDN